MLVYAEPFPERATTGIIPWHATFMNLAAGGLAYNNDLREGAELYHRTHFPGYGALTKPAGADPFDQRRLYAGVQSDLEMVYINNEASMHFIIG